MQSFTLMVPRALLSYVFFISYIQKLFVIQMKYSCISTLILSLFTR